MKPRWFLRAGLLLLPAAALGPIHLACQGGAPGADAFEPDNTFTEAKAINPGETQTHSIFPGGDVDFVTFTLTETASVTIEAPALGRIAVRLWQGRGVDNFLRFSDGSDNGGVARIVCAGDDALAPGTYYVSVGSPDNGVVLSYDLTVSYVAAGENAYTISGTVSAPDGTGLPNVTLAAGGRTTTTDGSGNYALIGVGTGAHTVTPTRDGYDFFPPSSAINITDRDVSNVNFAGFETAGHSLMEATTDGDGIAAFSVNGSTARVKALDARTGNALAGITALLLTNGTDGLFVLVDSSGLFLPRAVGGFSAPGGPIPRTIDETTITSLIGSLALGGMQVDAITVDKIPESLWPYTLLKLASPQATVDRLLLDSSLDLINGSSYTTSVQLLAEQSTTLADGTITLSAMAVNQGTSIGDNAWNKYYESRGYATDADYDVRLPSTTLLPHLASDLKLIFVTPITDGIATTESEGTISGKIIDSTTAAPLANVAVTAYPFGAQTQTDANGDYSFSSLSVFDGDGSPYWLSATLAGYDPDFRLVTVRSAETTTANIPLNPVLSSDDAFRIVLEWGENPRDLDSHLWTPSPAHIYYVDRGSLGSAPFANLDVDDVTSYGPETVTIRQLESGTYTYAIHHFAGSGTLATSSARVKVYDQSGPIRLFIVPTSGAGIWWTVFTINGSTGAITAVNTIQGSAPVGP